MGGHLPEEIGIEIGFVSRFLFAEGVEAEDGALAEIGEAELMGFEAEEAGAFGFERGDGLAGELGGEGRLCGVVGTGEDLIDGIVHALVDDGCDAAATPGGLDEGIDEFELDGVLGFELGEDLGDIVLVDGFVFGLEDVLVGIEAVLESVEAGFEFAFAGFWAGAFLSVTTIGCDLFFGCHGYLSCL